MSYRLLTENNAKTSKGEALGYLTGILYLRPDVQLCPGASAACMSACLVGAGRARIFPAIAAARARRTHYLRENPDAFQIDLCADVRLLVKRAARMNLKSALRLNGTSDIGALWNSIGENEKAPRRSDDMRLLDDAFDWTRALAKDLGAVTYEYSKRPELMGLGGRSWTPHHRTFSFNGQNHAACKAAIEAGHAVAVVYDRDDRRRSVPLFGFDAEGKITRYEPREKTYRTIDGDESDARFLDRERFGIPEGQGYFVALKLKHTKHDAKARAEGFAV